MKFDETRLLPADTFSAEGRLRQWIMDHPNDPLVRQNLGTMTLFMTLALLFLLALLFFIYKLVSAENKRMYPR